MFTEFPYTNFHDLNLDWIIKIAKDFLDQYTHIQETIDTGLSDIDTKASEVQTLLDEWYETHSQDIADQLADALQDLSTALTTTEQQFSQYASQRAAEAIESIPSDYTELYNRVETVKYSLKSGFPTDYYNGYVISTGDEVPNTAYYSTGYMPLAFIKSIKCSVTYGLVFFDKDYTAINIVQPSENEIYTIIPTNTKKFVRMWCMASSYTDLMEKFTIEYYDANYVYNNLTKYGTPFWTIGYITSAGAYMDDPNYTLSDYIACSDIYSITTMNNKTLNINYFNKDKQHVALVQIPTTGTYYIPYNPSYVYCRYWIAENNFDNMENDVSCVIALNPNYISNYGMASVNTSYLNGKTAVCYGDSLTWYDGNAFTYGPYMGQICKGFESYMREWLNIITTNRGVSGYTTPSICTTIRNANDLNNFDYLTIMGGDNDDRLNVTIGTLLPIGSVFTTNTVYGALQSAVEYALSQNPDIKIIIMSEPHGWTYRNGTLESVNDDIANAYKRVAELYALTYIDLWGLSGVNELTRTTYFADPAPADNTTYMYHPNNACWFNISRIICNTIDRM